MPALECYGAGTAKSRAITAIALASVLTIVVCALAALRQLHFSMFSYVAPPRAIFLVVSVPFDRPPSQRTCDATRPLLSRGAKRGGVPRVILEDSADPPPRYHRRFHLSRLLVAMLDERRARARHVPCVELEHRAVDPRAPTTRARRPPPVRGAQ